MHPTNGRLYQAVFLLPKARLRNRSHCLASLPGLFACLETDYTQRRNESNMKSKAEAAHAWLQKTMDSMNKGQVLFTAFMFPIGFL